MKPMAFERILPAETVSVQGRPYLFTNMRVDRKTIPDGWHAYDVRDDDCDGEFWEIQHHVMVNHWGVIIGPEPIELDDFGQYWCPPEPNDRNLSSEGVSLGFSANSAEEFADVYEKLKEKCPKRIFFEED